MGCGKNKDQCPTWFEQMVIEYILLVIFCFASHDIPQLQLGFDTSSTSLTGQLQTSAVVPSSAGMQD